VIVGSLLLIVVAIGLLVLGLVQGANALLVASIAASLLAALALIVGGRQMAAARAASRAGQGGHDDLELADEDLRRTHRTAQRQPVGAGVGGGSAFGTGAGPGGDAGAERDDESSYGGAAYGGSAPSHAPDDTVTMAPVRDADQYESSIPQQHDGDRFRDAAVGGDDDYDDDEDDEEPDDEPDDEPPAQQTAPGDAARVAAMSAEVFVIDGRPRYHLRGCVHMLGRESEPLPVGEAVELGFTPCSVCEPDSALLAAARRV
jgi:hypothetical protein